MNPQKPNSADRAIEQPAEVLKKIAIVRIVVKYDGIKFSEKEICCPFIGLPTRLRKLADDYEKAAVLMRVIDKQIF